MIVVLLFVVVCSVVGCVSYLVFYCAVLIVLFGLLSGVVELRFCFCFACVCFWF